MKFLHTAFLLVFGATMLHSQTLEFRPVQDNPLLKSFAAQQAAQDAALVEQLLGHKPPVLPSGDRSEICPPSLDGYFVAAGDSIEITLDTFGLMLGSEPATMSIANQGGLLFGTAVLNDTFLYISYKATAGFTGAGIDTVQFKLSQPGHDTIVPIEIFVRRKARVVVTQPQTVQPESITTFCLGNQLDFAKPKICSRSFDGPDNYDGAGLPIFHLSSYDYPDTCLVYYASRFPGVDTVNMRICDEWGVCDIFKVPYVIPGDTISIAAKPFFDDFSAYAGPYPSSKFWLDKNVYLNYTLAKDPPSVGLVTFDGLDRRGDKYPVVNGVGDRLTSKPIDLSSYNANSDVFLRFFLAPKGYGLPPDVTDNMVLEFRNANRQWVKVGTYDGIGNVSIDSFPPFVFYAIKVDNAQFFHKAFQFRFSATTSPSGSVDLWHLDYVQLSKNEGSNSNFSDIAFTQQPTSILKNYTAMPWKHFKGFVSDETQDQLQSRFYNHNDNVRALTASSITFRELTTATNIGSFFTVVESGTDNNMDPKVHSGRNRTIPAGIFSQIKNELDGIPQANKRVLETTFAFVETSQNQLFESNDTVKLKNEFFNYFAHDDGTAEWQAYIAHAEGIERFATKFHTNVEDKLEAVQFMFPHVNGDVQEQLFNVEIYVGSLDNPPVLVRSLLKPFYPNNVYDTLQGFTTYVLNDFGGNPTPVTIPAGSDFYISFQQASSAALGIPIGFDLQNPCDCSWSNLKGNGWSKFSSGIKGSLMIRPVFGSSTNTNSPTNEPVGNAGTSGIKVYPNPTTGHLNFTLKNGNFHDFNLTVFNNLGQPVSQSALESNLYIGNLPGGIYHLRFLNKKTGELFSERIILAKD